MAKKPSKKPPGSAPASEADSPVPVTATLTQVSRPATANTNAPTPEAIASDSRDATDLSSGLPAARPMRLKILYSLDELMPNCLARAKDVVHVRVAYLDEHTPVGFVDLKTCVLNVVYSSPEIMHHQGCDYSVYAYDFSEPDTPMIGLGLLSWVLSLPALNGQQPDPDAIDPAQANRMVTGRVQKNLLGLFAGDVKETLEVRMRLCRVPTLKHTDFLNHMNSFSQLSRNMPSGADPASQWASSMMNQNQAGFMQPGPQGGMLQYPPSPYMPQMQQGPPGYPPMSQYQHGPQGYMGPHQGYPQAYQQPPQGLQHGSHQQLDGSQQYPSQAPTPPASQTQATQDEVPEPDMGGAVSAPATNGVTTSTTPSSPPPQAQPLPAGAIGPGETDKEESVADPNLPAPKKRRVAPKRPGTGKPRGRPRLTDIRRSNTDTQPNLREDQPKDPAATDVVSQTIKQAPTPSSPGPSPNLVSTTTSSRIPASNLSTADSTAGSPHTSLSQATPLPAPSSTAPSPVALVPVLCKSTDMVTQELATSNLNEDVEMEMLGDMDNDADTEVAESPRDSDVDSLFIGSSPPPTNPGSADLNPSSPGTQTNPQRPPSIGFFPSRPRQTTHTLQEALSRGDSSDDEQLPLPNNLHLPKTATPEVPIKDNRSPSEKTASPKDAEDLPQPVPQPAPRKRGRPPKNPALKTESSNILPSEGATSPTNDSDGDRKKDMKSKPKRPPPAPVPSLPPPNLPAGLTFPAPAAKEVDQGLGKKRRSSDAGSDGENGPSKRGSTTSLVRARIERQMVEKLLAGEMPTYCMHCGAIETPTWRKAKVMMADAETGEEMEREVTLCNPCGLWHHNHGTMRPEQYWDKRSSEEKGLKSKRKPRKRVSLMKQESTLSTGSMRQSSSQPAVPSSPPPRSREDSGHRATSPVAPTDKDGTSEWGTAVNKNLRRIQSSPCGVGTVTHPISLLSPDQKTRRKLFPEAKRSPKGLDGTISPVEEEEVRTEGSSSPDEPVGSPEMEKENNPPPVEGVSMDIDWERELERELLRATADGDVEIEAVEEAPEDVEDTPGSDDAVRPATPEQQISPPNMEFKTPIRLTPLLASVNVDSPSFWKSGMLGVATPSGKVITAHPTPTPSKLGLGNTLLSLVSPATGEIMLEFLNEWSKTEEPQEPASPTPANREEETNEEMQEEFFSEINFDMMDEDLALTSEANVMPSSPPALFNLYDEDPTSLVDAVSSSLFSEVLPTSPGNCGTYHLDLGDDDGTGKDIMEEPIIDLNFDFDDALVVDFSDLVPGAAKVAAMGAAVAAPVEGLAAVTSEKKESSEDDSSSTEDK